MIIKRLQVQEGFLDELDLTFSHGLNVIIGPRGAGKTSIIELIRFCLNVEPLTERTKLTAKEHALSILGAGCVTVTLQSNDGEITIKRTAESWTASRTANFESPIILSQNEIELVGLHALGRLKIIDSIRTPDSGLFSQNEETLITFIRSQTEQRQSIADDLNTIRAQLKNLLDQLKDTEEEKKQLVVALGEADKAQDEKLRLAMLSSWQAQVSVRAAVYDRVILSLQQRLQRLQSFGPPLIIEPWPVAAACDDQLINVRQALAESDAQLKTAIDKIHSAITSVRNLTDFNRSQLTSFEEESRTLRKKLEMLQQGAGEASRRLSHITEKLGQQSALHDLEKSKILQLQVLQNERKRHLDDLEKVKSARFLARKKVVDGLNQEFAPRIKISIEQAGINSAYSTAIIAALRGSGIKFNDAAPLISDNISPRELVEFVESDNADELSNLTGLAPARAARIIERIREEGVEDILTARIEDSITISLLDGAEYKTTEHLSMGQRCTVILPLLLKQTVAPLIVDQPEDHLDNGFVVETLIKAIVSRKNKAQLIFSTHNANIPVLGGADKVILMGSNGVRGFIRSAEALDHSQSIDAITNIMEGGLAAFELRSVFYHKNSL
jgi:ABC-type cobalamin/Fe3+-siderophores transport system ATPase subunit